MAMHIVDRRLNPGSKSLENWAVVPCVAQKRWFRMRSRGCRRTATSRMSWRAARSAFRSMGWTSHAFIVGGARATWCFPETRSMSRAIYCRVPARARARATHRGPAKVTAKTRSDSFLNRDEFVDLFLDDLELPDLAKRRLAEADSESSQRAGYTNSGSPANLSVSRTVRPGNGSAGRLEVSAT